MVAKFTLLACRPIEGRTGGPEGQGGIPTETIGAVPEGQERISAELLGVVPEGRGGISDETLGVVAEGRGGFSAEMLGVVPEGRGGSAIINICDNSCIHSNVSDTYNLNFE